MALRRVASTILGDIRRPRFNQLLHQPSRELSELGRIHRKPGGICGSPDFSLSGSSLLGSSLFSRVSSTLFKFPGKETENLKRRNFSTIPSSTTNFSVGLTRSSTSLLTGFSTPNNGCPLIEVAQRFKSKKGKYNVPFRPEPLKALKMHGLFARMSTKSGRAILMRRILRGRKYLTH